MPKFEELPIPAQNEIRQARADAEDEHPQKEPDVAAAAGLPMSDWAVATKETEPPIAGPVPRVPAMGSMPAPDRKPQRSGRAANRDP